MRWCFLAAIVAGLLIGCGDKAAPEAPAATEVSVVRVALQDAPVDYQFVGQTQSSNQVQIVARVNGFLDEQLYVEGSMVNAGDVMFRQDPKPFQATLSAAKAALSQQLARLQVARDNLRRVQPLVKLNALAQKDLDDAIGQEASAAAAVEMARADVETAELNLGYTTIRTPVSGMSSYARVNVGAYLDPQNSLLTYVSPLDPIYVNFSVSENEMLTLRSEQAAGLVTMPANDQLEVEVILANGETFDQKGRITFADADFNQQTSTFLLRATLPNPKGLLRPGQFVRVNVIGASRPHAILVPQQSVLQGAKGHFVVLVGKDNTAVMRPVQVGPWHGDEWFITDGLQAGDVVVVDGVARLSPGSPVKIVSPATSPDDSATTAKTGDAAATTQSADPAAASKP
jgi:membrane fusion protein (multidrug efflux system)